MGSMVKALKFLLERDNQKKGIAKKAEEICYRSLRSQFFYPKQAISRAGQLNMSFLQKLRMAEQELKKKRQIN